MTSKERHRKRILDFLGNPDNDYPPRQDYAKLCNFSIQRMYQVFPPAELQDIENEAYEIRKKNSTKQRSEVLKAMLAEAKSGNVSAANLFLERTEGKVADKLQMSGKVDSNLKIEFVACGKQQVLKNTDNKGSE